MKILVIGGSYFLGRVFVMQASGKHEITMLNRGTYSMENFGVKQIRGDRRDETLWRRMEERYDAIVDFCAYEEGDIAKVLQNMAGKVTQYVLISTVDVYQRGTGKKKDEDTALETRNFPGEAGAYIAGKVALEQELRVECAQKEIEYTVLRPAIVYGPYNYAPRESAYIQLLVQNHILPRIMDAEGSFQCVYVKDAAEAALKCLLQEKAYGQAYNLCQDQVMTYASFLEALKNAADVEFDEIPITVEQARAQGIPLPFAVTGEESELCCNEKGKKEMGFEYIDFQEGMARTYRAFRGVFRQE